MSDEKPREGCFKTASRIYFFVVSMLFFGACMGVGIAGLEHAIDLDYTSSVALITVGSYSGAFYLFFGIFPEKFLLGLPIFVGRHNENTKAVTKKICAGLQTSAAFISHEQNLMELDGTPANTKIQGVWHINKSNVTSHCKDIDYEIDRFTAQSKHVFYKTMPHSEGGIEFLLYTTEL